MNTLSPVGTKLYFGLIVCGDMLLENNEYLLLNSEHIAARGLDQAAQFIGASLNQTAILSRLSRKNKRISSD